VDHLLRHLRRRPHLVNGMDLKMMELHLYVVDSFQFQHLQDVVHLDALQNLDEQILDAHLPYLDEAHLLDVVVGVELRHQLRMDYFLDVVGVELRHQLRMDYFLDVVDLHLVQQEFLDSLVLQELQLLHLLQPLLPLLQLSLHRVMP
jgi:hypothetical protein